MKIMEVQPHHKTPENIIELFMMLCSLLLAGAGSLIGHIHNLFVLPPMLLHYIFMTAQGMCYMASTGVGGIAMYKFFSKKGKKENEEKKS